MLSPRFFIYELFDPIKEKIVLHTTIILDSISLYFLFCKKHFYILYYFFFYIKHSKKKLN